MYKKFYGFQQDPFSVVPNPDFLYLSSTHREALAQLLYGVQSGKGFIVITGEVGVGKTTILRAFLNELENMNALSALIFNPRLDLMDFFQLICEEFELPRPKSKAEFLLTFQSFLIDCYKKRKIVVLIIDEAQQLSSELLEEIRLLLNLETHHVKLLQVVLSGQPELWERLKTPELRQLRQRIALRHLISPLNREETEAYIKQRLKMAGGNEDIFEPQAIDRIYQLSKGIPRTINVICTNALITGFALGKENIDKAIIDEVAIDLDLLPPEELTKKPKEPKEMKEPKEPKQQDNKWPKILKTAGIGLALGVMIFGGIYWYRINKNFQFSLSSLATLLDRGAKKNVKPLSTPTVNNQSSEQIDVVKTHKGKTKAVGRLPETTEIEVLPQGLLYTLYRYFGFVNNKLIKKVAELNPDLFSLPLKGPPSDLEGKFLYIPSTFHLQAEGKYAIHIATMTDLAKIKRLFWQLIGKGHEVLVYPTLNRNKVMFRIGIGEYNTYQEALSTAKEYVKQKRLSQALVVKIPSEETIKHLLFLQMSNNTSATNNSPSF